MAKDTRAAERRRDALLRLHHAARRIDRSRWAAPELASRISTRIYERRRALAAERSPIWAAEERGRARPDGSYVFSGDGYTYEQWRAHSEHFEALAPEPRYARLVDLLSGARTAALTGAALDAYDRITRGWTDTDLWNLGTSNAATLGQQLQALARQAHGWPCHAFASYEDWTAALTLHGTALSDYADDAGLSDLYDEREALLKDNDPDGVEEQDARIAAREAELEAGATRAYEWIARHHAHLWD